MQILEFAYLKRNVFKMNLTNVKLLKKTLFIVDFLIIFVICFAVINLSGTDNLIYPVCFFECVLIFFFGMFDMYSFKRKRTDEDVVSVFLSVIITIVLYLAADILFIHAENGIINSLIISLCCLLFISVWRAVFDSWYIKSVNKRKTLIIESKSRPSRLARKIKYSFANTENVMYYLIDEDNEDDMKLIYSQIDSDCDDIILLDGLSENIKGSIMNYAICRNKKVGITETFSKAAILNGVIKLYQDTPIISVSPISIGKVQLFVKRTFDIVFSIVGIILSSPFLAVCAIAIKAESEGPVIYKQERYTIGKKVFNCYKFRTMRTDAEKNGAQLASKNDPRLTRVGKFIRKTRLDELPQLFNVLEGDMSFVGPRPERPVFADEFCKNVTNYSMRYTIKAGITGYAQVYGNYSSRASDKVLLDLIYALNYSLLLDIKLILLTVRQVFIHESAEGCDAEFDEEMDRYEREILRRNNLKDEFNNNEKDFDYNCRL